MAFDFPNSPTVGQLYTAPTGLVYTWDGEKWGSGSGYGAIYIADSAPTAPVGSLWWESDTGNLYVNYNDGNSIQWVMIVGSIINAVLYTPQTLTAGQQLQARQNIGVEPPLVRSYLAGLTLSTAGSSTTFGIAAGVAADSTNIAMMTLAAAITKTTSPWTLGSAGGALDTGIIQANAWYHAYLIRRPDTGAVDVAISTSAVGPTTGLVIPGAYTQSRRIGSMLTNASSQWLLFHQLGDEFLFDVGFPIAIGTTVSDTVAHLLGLATPPGIQVWALITGIINAAANVECRYFFSSPDKADETNSGAFNAGSYLTTTSVATAFSLMIRTNTIQQIRYRAQVANTILYLNTAGWIDRRGRDA